MQDAIQVITVLSTMKKMALTRFQKCLLLNWPQRQIRSHTVPCLSQPFKWGTYGARSRAFLGIISSQGTKAKGEREFLAKFCKLITMPKACALCQVLVGKTFPRIWCNKTKPKKSYAGPKLRYLHFVWGFRCMMTLGA